MAAKRINPIFSRLGVGRARVVKLKKIKHSMPAGTVEDVFWRDYDMPPNGPMTYVEKPTYVQKTFLAFMFFSVVASSMYVGFRSSQIHWPALIAALAGQTLETTKPSLQTARPIATSAPAAPQELTSSQVITVSEPVSYTAPIPPLPLGYGHGPEISAEAVSTALSSPNKDSFNQVADEEPISVELVASVNKKVSQNNTQDDTVTLDRSGKTNSILSTAR